MNCFRLSVVINTGSGRGNKRPVTSEFETPYDRPFPLGSVKLIPRFEQTPTLFDGAMTAINNPNDGCSHRLP